MNMAAGKVEIGDFLSNSDQEIFESFLKLSSIKKETFIYNSYKSAKSNLEKQVSSIVEGSSVHMSSSNEDSAYASPGILHKNDLKLSGCAVPLENYHNLKYDIACIQVTENLLALKGMFDSVYNQIEDMQVKRKNFHEDNIKKAENIISFIKFKERLERINLVLEHIYKISEKLSKLKHLFRSSDQNNYIKVKIEYHGYVLNFFDMIKQISKSLEEDLQNFENCGCLDERELAYEEFYKMIQKLTLDLHKSVDILQEFRGYLKSNINLI